MSKHPLLGKKVKVLNKARGVNKIVTGTLVAAPAAGESAKGTSNKTKAKDLEGYADLDKVRDKFAAGVVKTETGFFTARIGAVEAA